MELELVYNEETQELEQKPEPFITIECETEEDFEFIGTAIAFYNKHLEEQEKPQINADRIRAWNDHELAETIANFVSEIDNGDVRYSDDPNDWLKWLQQPAEEG